MTEEVKDNLPEMTDDQIRLLAIKIISNRKTVETLEFGDEVRGRIMQLLVKTAGPHIPEKFEIKKRIVVLFGRSEYAAEAEEYRRNLSFLTAIGLISNEETLKTAELPNETKIDTRNLLIKTANLDFPTKAQVIDRIISGEINVAGLAHGIRGILYEIVKYEPESHPWTGGSLNHLGIPQIAEEDCSITYPETASLNTDNIKIYKNILLSLPPTANTSKNELAASLRRLAADKSDIFKKALEEAITALGLK